MDIVSIALAYALVATPPVPVFVDDDVAPSPYHDAIPQPETETIFEPIHGFIQLTELNKSKPEVPQVFDATTFPPEKKSIWQKTKTLAAKAKDKAAPVAKKAGHGLRRACVLGKPVADIALDCVLIFGRALR